MPKASELLQPAKSVWLWQAYDPAVRSDLFSTAVKTSAGLFLIDPIPLAAGQLKELAAMGSVAGIFITNLNHCRAAADFARRFEVTIFAAESVSREFQRENIGTNSDCDSLGRGITAIAIEGAATGETVFHFVDDGGTMVVGDALINFEPYGFTFLPAKYCSDQKQMRRSLARLLDWPFQRLFFAHGTPILHSARQQLETLLA
ncbi:MAG TPA: hypothetical protein VGF73_03330 [Chthoniobacterales bacterium]|jgi:glyoxylase-like metal-dependent hydrolase (beta-lactamase superfamily II)